MLYRICLGFFAVLFAACSTPEPKAAPVPFFDLATYFEEQSQILQGKTIEKTISYNSAAPEVSQNPIEANALQLFKESNIDNPSKKEQYTIDSVFVDKQLEKLVYKTDALKIKEIVIKYQANKVKSIQINKQTNNFFYTSKQQLTYQPDSGYQMELHQDVIFSTPNTLKLSVKFL